MGKLYTKSLAQYQNWFDEASQMLGIDVEYRFLLKRNTENATGESVYSELSDPILQSIIVEEGIPKIDSLKQLGWFTDTEDEQLLVDFSIKTPNLQEGCRFKFVNGTNSNQNKEYTIIKLSSEQLYPSCIKCLCIPVINSKYSIKNNKTGDILYQEQSIYSDEENNTFINAEPKISMF